MELTPQQKEAIYYEEKAKREGSSSSASTEILIIFTALAAAALYGVYSVGRKPPKRKISIDLLRRAYSGLAPDDM